LGPRALIGGDRSGPRPSACRCAATPVVFTATLWVTVPRPDPLAPAVILTQLTLLVAVHEHDVPVVTDRLPVVAVDGTGTFVVEGCRRIAPAPVARKARTRAR
jgi:hypothetical protein